MVSCAGKDKSMETGKRKPPLTLLGVVCDRERQEKVITLLEGEKSFFNMAMLGKGTANSRILGYLGLGHTDKTVIFCIMPVEVARRIQQKLDEKLDFSKPGHGIAFMAKIHEGCYHKPIHITHEEVETVENTQGCDLIMVVTNRGYTEEVMDVARAEGATGGTVLHARGCGLSGAEKFFGVTIQPEREIIMIVAKDTISCAIMAAIAEKTGPESDAGAVSFSMPVSNVMGIGRDVPKDMV